VSAPSCAADQATAEIRERVGRPHRQQHGEREEARLGVHPPKQLDVPKSKADPGRAEHGRADRDRRRCSRLGDRIEEKRERERRQEAGEEPDDTAVPRARQSERDAEVRRRAERT